MVGQTFFNLLRHRANPLREKELASTIGVLSYLEPNHGGQTLAAIVLADPLAAPPASPPQGAVRRPGDRPRALLGGPAPRVAPLGVRPRQLARRLRPPAAVGLHRQPAGAARRRPAVVRAGD